MVAQKGVKTVFTKGGSIVNLGLFSIQLTRSDNLGHLGLAISKESKRTESACCAISGKSFSKEIMLTASVPVNLYLYLQRASTFGPVDSDIQMKLYYGMSETRWIRV